MIPQPLSKPGLGAWVLLAFPLAAQPPCAWQPDFTALAGTDRRVTACCLHDDGTGPKLVFAGDFTIAGGQPAPGIGTFDGTTLQPFAPGLPFTPSALVSFDSGGGPVLHAADPAWWSNPPPVSGVVRLVNGAWQPLGVLPPGVFRLRVLDDGSGPALYATVILGWPGADVYRFDGAAWIPLGSGAEHAGDVAIFDDGAGPRLFAAGGFPGAQVLARRDPSGWTLLGPNFSGTKNVPHSRATALAVHDDGTGPALFVGGWFAGGGIGADHMVRYAAGGFSAAGALGGFASDTEIADLMVFDAGPGARLYAAGIIDNLNTAIAAWDGTAWTNPGGAVLGERYGHALSRGDLGSGPRLFLAGEFEFVAGSAASNLAAYDGVSWSPLHPGVAGLYGPRAFEVFDSGTGRELVFSGDSFGTAGTGPGFVRAWNGSALRSLGSLAGIVNDFLPADFGAGPRLFATGGYWTVGSMAAPYFAAWNGSAWSAPAPGLAAPSHATPYSVRGNDLLAFDDDIGTRVFVGGNFEFAGGLPARAIARFDGAAFSSVPGTQGFVECRRMVVLPEPSGARIYAAVNGPPDGMRVHRFDGAAWTPAGAMLWSLEDLAVFDGGAGPEIYAAGQIASQNGVFRLANGAWVLVGPVIAADPWSRVETLHVHDDGRGPALFAAGGFLGIGGVSALNIARYDGAVWTPLGGGADGRILGLATFDPGAGPGLYAGGDFGRVSGVISPRLAHWACSRPVVLPVQIFGPGTGVYVANANLTPGGLIYNIFSPPGPGPLGAGPFLGLWGPLAAILPQVSSPLGTHPFHFLAPAPVIVTGPYIVPPVTLDALCIDATSGVASTVVRVSIL